MKKAFCVFICCILAVFAVSSCMFDDDDEAGETALLSEETSSDSLLHSDTDADISDCFVVTFDSDGGTDVPAQKVKNGEIPVNPGKIEKQGTVDTEYVFIGWYLNDELYNFDSELSGNIILTAKWEVKKYGEPLDF